MACIAILKRPFFNVDNTAKEGYEFPNCDVAAKDSIYLCTDHRPICERPHCRLHIRHEQSSGHALSNHIANAHRKLLIAKLQHVEVITAYRSCRLPRSSDVEPGNLRNLLRQ